MMKSVNVHRFLPRFALIATSLLFPAVTASAQEAKSTNRFAGAQNRFGMNLLATLHKGIAGNTNLFVSPMSVSSALAMAWSGAGGTTKTALGKTLAFNGMTVSEVAESYSTLRTTLVNTTNPFRLQIANALWTDKSVTLAPSFVTLCRQQYGAEAESLNIAMAPDEAARIINQWTSTNTQGKIPTIIQPANLRSVSAVLTNAVYFKAAWESRFPKAATRPAPFTLANGSVVKPPMMTQQKTSPGTFRYLEGNGFTAARIPYQSSGKADVAMYLFLPNKGRNIAATMDQVAKQPWAKTVAGFKSVAMVLTIPRFKTEYSVELVLALQQLGAGVAFSNAADFDPMGLHRHRIGRVIHKTFIAVDEAGTEAAAATAVTMMPLSVQRPTKPVVFTADHPFFYLIADDTTGTILFAGTLNDPTK